MTAAIAVTTWAKGEAQRVYGILGESDESRDMRKLAEWIGRHGGRVTARDLQRGPRRYRAADDAETALAALVAAGMGRWETAPARPTGGRPTRVFALGDSGDGDGTPADPEPDRGCVTVATVTTPKTEPECVGQSDDGWGEV